MEVNEREALSTLRGHLPPQSVERVPSLMRSRPGLSRTRA